MDALLPETQDEGRALDAFFDAVPIAAVLVGADERVARANAAAESLFGYERGRLAGRALGELLGGRTIGDPERGDGRVARKADGTEIRVAAERIPGPAGVTILVLEEASAERRVRPGVRTYATERRSRERALALARLSAAVAKASTAHEVGRILLEELFDAAPSSTTALALLDEPAGEFELVGVLTRGQVVATRERWSVEMASAARDVVRSRQPLLVDRAEYEARYPEIVRISDPGGLVRYLALPIVAGAHAIGAVGLSFEFDPGIDDAAIAHLQSLVDAGAQALARARLEDAERSTRRLFAAVVDQMPLGILVIEAASRRVLYANDGFYALFGLERGDPGAGIPGGRDSATRILRLDGTEWPAEERPYVRAVAGERVTDEIVVVELPDVTRRVVSISAGPVRDESGVVVAGVVVYTDVTARREAEAARDAFISILSHELRTPITSIYAGATVIERRAADPATADVARDVSIEAERLFRLVEDLLVLSRVERGVDLRRSDPVLLHHVVRRIIELEAKRWPGTRFELDIPGALPTVGGDEAYVEQIVRNLVSNAAKYGPPGGLVRVVAAHDGDEVVVRVLDEGPGFEAGEEDSVFRLFFRAPRTSGQAPGAGIGLYAVRALAAAMGGRAWARCRDEGGAEVAFALRLFADEDAEPRG